MKIKNIDRFRNEIIGALNECYATRQYESTGFTEEAAKNALIAKCNIYDYKSARNECLALYNPIKVGIYHGCKTPHAYLVADEACIRIYKDTEDEYILKNILFYEMYNNKLNLMVCIVNNINYILDNEA
jgi:hypothetical protein